MQNKTVRLQGVVLRVVQYGAAHQLATVYTSEMGVVKCSRRGALSLRGKGTGSPLTPLAEVELVVRKSSSEVHLCQEAFCLTRHHQQAPDYKTLELACRLADTIVRSQPLEAPTPALFHLFLKLLQSIHNFHQPETAQAALQLKLLQHEGLLHPLSVCQTCQSKSDPLKVLRGEPFCLSHAPPFAISFVAEELETVNWLLQIRQLSALQETQLSASVLDKSERLFRQLFPTT